MKANWDKINEWTNENKGMLIMVADPRTDQVLVTFNEQRSFVQFPFESMDKGIVFNCLRKSSFHHAIDGFITGLIKATGLSEKDGNQLYHVLGGSIRALGMESEKSKLEIVKKPKKNAKKSK